MPLDVNAPDFSVACIRFASGVVARLTCSIIAPHDHSLKIIGDEGILGINDCWYYGAPVYIKRMIRVRRKTFISPWKQRYPLVKTASKFRYSGSQQMDFCRGIAEMVAAITEDRPSRLSARYSLHNNEVVLAIHNALETGSPCKISSSFDPIEPLPWAKS